MPAPKINYLDCLDFEARAWHEMTGIVLGWDVRTTRYFQEPEHCIRTLRVACRPCDFGLNIDVSFDMRPVEPAMFDRARANREKAEKLALDKAVEEFGAWAKATRCAHWVNYWDFRQDPSAVLRVKEIESDLRYRLLCEGFDYFTDFARLIEKEVARRVAGTRWWLEGVAMNAVARLDCKPGETLENLAETAEGRERLAYYQARALVTLKHAAIALGYEKAP